MTVRQYIGARYVPIFSDPIQWDSTSSYEPLTVVMNQGTSYVSKQSVPAGIDITNETYWLRWADYNAQLEEYIRQVQTYTASVDAINDALPIADFDANNTVKDAIDTINDALPIADFDANNTVKDAIDIIEANSWVTTNRIADNAVTADKIADNAVAADKIADDNKTYINVLAYGIVNDGNTDNFEALQTLLDDTSDAGGGTLYFPAGQYNVSNTIVIDDNIRITGDGASSIIYGAGTSFRRFGVVLAIIGNNCKVDNIFGSHYGYDDNFNAPGSNYGFLGIASYTRETLESYILNESSTLEQRTTKGIIIDNFFSNSFYPLQAESVNVKDVTYSNIYAPNGVVSFQSNADYYSGMFTASNIICALFRTVGNTDDNSYCVNVSNLICNAIYSTLKGANFENVYVDYFVNNKVAQWILAATFDYNAIATFVDATNINNLVINMHDTIINKWKLFIQTLNVKPCQISNITFLNVTDSVNENIEMRESGNGKILASNIDFSQANSTVPHKYNGYFNNCLFGSVNVSLSNIRAQNYNRDLTGYLVADTANLSNVSRFSNAYQNSIYLHNETANVFYAIGFTAKTVTAEPNLRIAIFNIDIIKPKYDKYVTGFVLDASANKYEAAIFKITTDGIYLAVSSALSISKVMFEAEYIVNA